MQRGGIRQWAGRGLARYLSAPTHCAPRHAPSDIERVKAALQPCDVLLVEGRSRFSSAIKFLTHSVWSHAALYVGADTPGDANCFVEADVVDGVRTVGFDEFTGYGLRICRPRGLSAADAQAVINAARQRVGHRYDLRNIVDLLRYLWPTPPVPGHLRRRLLALGSGDPTRAICSSLIAQCFQSVRYPILPRVEQMHDDPYCSACAREQWHIRHHSLFVPADFDLSPYFEVVKPQALDVDYRALPWG